MKEPTAVLTANYLVYVDETRTKYIVTESGDTPQLTEIIQSESHGDEKQSTRLVIENENLPKLIEALQRRYEDCKRDPEA
jgi:hypothetical protein